MRDDIIPFWDEVMTNKEQTQKVSELFELLENGLASVVKNDNSSDARTYIFAPNPPTLDFKIETQRFNIYRLSWGHAGEAVATDIYDVAVNLAPVIFKLGSDSLYVIALNEKAPDKATLEQWVDQILRTELNIKLRYELKTIQTPSYAFLYFDWGDLVLD